MFVGTALTSAPHGETQVATGEVAMEERDELNPEDGKPTGRKYTPERPYPRTCLAKEMMNITINGIQVFHSFVINQSGPDVGVTAMSWWHVTRSVPTPLPFDSLLRTLSRISTISYIIT